MKKFLTSIILLTLTVSAVAQKSVYIPDEWRYPWNPDTLLYAESDPDNKYTWSKSRSIESDNVIVFWDKGYGSKKPSQSPSAYRIDEQDLLQKCEAFYDLEINRLGFVNPATTNLRHYKVMVLLNHTTDWVCYGGGYDFEVSALWLGPSACKPVGHSVAHEVGHSFHYMCYADASGNNHNSSQTIGTGFHLPVGNGQAIWEQTAQWQAAQSYPQLMFDQSISLFRNTHNYAFSHEWHRYQSYWLHYFLCQYYDDITTVGQVWRQPMTGAVDFNQALMKLKNLTPEQLFRLYFDYACRCATWDFDAAAPYRQPYIGDFNYRCVLKGDREYQVALASCPQSTGFNVIPLEVPEAGTVVTTHFTALRTGTALCDADPGEYFNGDTFVKVAATARRYNAVSAQSARGFRVGYVALMADGTRRYFACDSIYGQGVSVTTADISLTVPQNVSRMWLVVTPALKRYIQHQWDEKIAADDMWPYSFRLEGTDLAARAMVYASATIDGRRPADITLTYDATFPRSSTIYPGVQVAVTGQAAAALGTALQLQPTDIAPLMQTYSSSGPTAGHIMFYALSPTDASLVRSPSTANGYGHWFGAAGAVSPYSSGYVYSEFDPAALTFTLGQYPGKCAAGTTYTIGQALRYKTADGIEAVARFVFCITIGQTADAPTATLRRIDYADPTSINLPPSTFNSQPSTFNSQPSTFNPHPSTYDVQGRPVTSPSRGIVITDGRKMMQR